MALSLDDTLLDSAKALLTQLDEADIAGFRAGFASFLLDWAGVSDIVPTSRGAYVDARHLAFLEALYGQGFRQGAGANPGHNAGDALEAQFSELVNAFAARFMAQRPAPRRRSRRMWSMIIRCDFLPPFARDLSPENFRLDGTLEATLLAGADAVSAGVIDASGVAAVLPLLRKDLGYLDAATLVADVRRVAHFAARSDDAHLEIAAAVVGLTVLSGAGTADTITAGSTATLLLEGLLHFRSFRRIDQLHLGQACGQPCR